MRRPLLVLLLCVLALGLAGCQAPGQNSDVTTDTTATNETATPQTVVLDEENRTATTPETPTGALGDGSTVDPESDRLGWERGYWHNESLSITTDDGLNESERGAVVARSMARVEIVRQLEFEKPVSVTVVSRTELQNDSARTHGETLRQFDNAKFEALFLIGEDEDSIAVQEQNLGESVLGYYSSSREAIVLVSDSETPAIAEGTLAHELVHALQDQHFGLESDARTRDAVQGRNGLVEGDAVDTAQRYGRLCGASWNCLSGGSGGGSGDRHFGVNFMKYFPYSDGPGFVKALRSSGRLQAVNAAYDDKPDGAVEVMNPSAYPGWEPESVSLADRSTGDWERVRPSTDRDRPDYAVVGPSAIAASMAYTLTDDYNESSVVRGSDVVNVQNGQIDSSDPYNYDLPAAQGWSGGKLYAYTDGEETGYVWKTAWESERDAREFAAAWEAVISHWGGTETAEGVWTVEPGSPFADAISVRVDGRTVTVVNAPAENDLTEIHDA